MVGTWGVGAEGSCEEDEEPGAGEQGEEEGGGGGGEGGGMRLQLLRAGDTLEDVLRFWNQGLGGD